ncbi:hypothetical protein F5Y11DRAFT_153697 [Daldinia sp. FL1419]|nr:hypothetical protein F5Y11DRAFT_153697 [Daldinia sp. FL1419]
MTQVKTIRTSYPTYLYFIQPKVKKRCHSRLMAVEATVGNTKQTLSLDSFSTEILTIIFRELRDVDPWALANARLVSRGFDTIITPIQFETICLNERIIDPLSEIYFPYFFRNMFLFTRHIRTRSNLDPENSRRLLDRVQKLFSLRWRCIENQYLRSPEPYISTPSDILSTYHLEINRTRIHVEKLPLDDLYSEIFIRGIPASNMASLDIIDTHLASAIDQLRRLLLRSPLVDNLNYNGLGQGVYFKFNEGERLPPFEGILLRSYDWVHTAEDVRKHWDFSRLRRLTLIDVPLYRFLTSVSPEQLERIREIHCADFSTHTSMEDADWGTVYTDRREDATRLLHSLIGGIRALDKINITCYTELFPIDAILRHANSLKHLGFRDYLGFEDETKRYPTLSIGDLTELSTKLVHLEFLEIGMDPLEVDPRKFLHTLCNFPRLKDLTLHTQTVWLPDFVMPNYEVHVDRDGCATMDTLRFLVRGKQNKQESTWRTVVINIGGWKPISLRIFPPRPHRNRFGACPQRCFEMKRDDSIDDYVVEDVCLRAYPSEDRFSRLSEVEEG